MFILLRILPVVLLLVLLWLFCLIVFRVPFSRKRVNAAVKKPTCWLSFLLRPDIVLLVMYLVIMPAVVTLVHLLRWGDLEQFPQ